MTRSALTTETANGSGLSFFRAREGFKFYKHFNMEDKQPSRRPAGRGSRTGLHGMRVDRICLLVAMCSMPDVSGAAELEAETVHAYEQYIARLERDFSRTEGSIWIEEASQATRLRLRSGEIFGEPGNEDGILAVPDGLIHHWRATAFIPDVSLEAVLAVAQDYSRYSRIYDWVVDSSLLGRERDADPERDRYWVLLRIKRSAKVVTSVVDLWTSVEYQYPRRDRATTVSNADCIREVENIGESDERRLPVGVGHGYLWRANTFSTYLQREGGVYIDTQTVGLSRKFPPLLGWLIEPIARRLGRGSAADTLKHLRQAVVERNNQGARVDNADGTVIGPPVAQAICGEPPPSP